MALIELHHASIVVTDLERAVAFYRDVIGLEQIPRPPFQRAGAWFAVGPSQLHLLVNDQGTLRPRAVIDTGDNHFAIRTGDFAGFVARLVAHGFREDAAETDPMRILVRYTTTAGFPQAYLLDPDRNVIEINAAP